MRCQKVLHKKRPVKTICITVTTLILSACSIARIPEPVGYPYSQQHKSQSAEHWSILAWDVANRINEQLVLSGNANRSVHVEHNCGSDALPCKPNETTPFNEAFRDLLITSLYDLRVPTTIEEQHNALDITFKVQLLHHDARRQRTVFPGALSTITSAIAVLRNAPTEIMLVGAGVIADFANTSFALEGHCEIIITTTMAKKGKYLFRSSDIYYINDPDFWHYLESFPEAEGVNFVSRHLKKKEDKKATNEIPQVLPIPPVMQQPNAQKKDAERPVFQTHKENI